MTKIAGLHDYLRTYYHCLHLDVGISEKKKKKKQAKEIVGLELRA